MPVVSISCFTDELGVRRVVLDPTTPITPYVCRICWNILDDTTAYCRRCGHSGAVFDYQGIPSTNCFTHPRIRAAEFCNYCSRPFCSDCLETNKGAIISFGTYTHKCRLCSAEIQRLKQQLPPHDEGFCLYHPDVAVRRTCTSCSNQMCRFCTYFPVTGILRKRVNSTPYCFSCMRSLISQRRFRHAVVEHFSGNGFRDYTF
jgi:hypothetical protein